LAAAVCCCCRVLPLVLLPLPLLLPPLPPLPPLPTPPMRGSWMRLGA
jgi:hypothetical protein